MTRRQFYLVLAIAFVLRLILAIRLDFWYDENFSIALSRLPFERMLEATAGDVHPPLYYTILWAWTHLVGNSPIWLVRLPSLAFSMGSILLTDQITRRPEFPARVNTAAVLMMAFVPFQVYFAAETRMYSLLGFLVLLGVECVLSKKWARLAIVAAALAYTNNWGLLYDAALFILALATNPPTRWNIIPLPFIAAAVLWLPWGITLAWQMNAINQSYWLSRVTPGLVLLQLHQLVFGMLLYNPLGTLLTFCLLMLGAYCIVTDAASARAGGLILIMLIIPFTLGVLISVLWQPILLFRAMSGLAPWLYLLLIWPVTRLTHNRALAAAVFIIPLLMLSYRALYFAPLKTDGGNVLDYINQHWQTGDVIVSTGDSQYVNLMNYTDKPLILLNECQLPLGGLTERTRRAMGYTSLDWDDIRAGRVWFLHGITPLVHQCNIDQANQITAGRNPVLVEQNDTMIFSAVWLLTK